MNRRPVFTTSEGTHRGSFGPSDWALFGSIGVIWGSSFVLIDIGLDAFAPGLVTWIRVTSGALALWLFSQARRPVDREDLPRVVALSLLWVAIPFTLFPVAQQWINSAVTGMLNGAMPIFAATVASILLRRAPRIAQTVGIAVGFLGVVAIGSPSMGRGSAEALGVLLVVLAVLCYGIAVNLAAPLQQRYGSLPVMARMLGLAAVWTLPLGVADLADSSFAWSSLIAVTVLGVVGTGLAFVIMGTLVGRVGSTRASFITYLIPVVALVLGVAFRGDRVTPVAGAGVILVVAGAILASRRED
jgi:drug/metabolite transporter (DMT)-like permease